jgi:hypothetical protein
MQIAQTFLDAGWDWVNERANGVAEVWLIPTAGGYPTLSIFSDEYEPKVLSGTGTSADPYQIGGADDLGAVCHHSPSAWYSLVDDIDLTGIAWATAPIPDFHGGFRGNGFAVRHLSIRGGGHLGLFGAIGAHATVVDVKIENASIVGAEHGACVGLLAGQSGGCLQRCSVQGEIAAGDSANYIGGLVGAVEGVVSQCRAVVDMSVGEDAEGLGGMIGTSTCRATDIGNCYARGSIRLDQTSYAIGGLVGDGYHCTISDSYAAVNILGEMPVDGLGGLIGREWESVLHQCYFLIGSGAGSDNGGGHPLTEMQMKSASAFSGWDFDRIWAICEGRDYPHLQWEAIPCEP